MWRNKGKLRIKLFIRFVYTKGKIVNNINVIEKIFSYKLNELRISISLSNPSSPFRPRNAAFIFYLDFWIALIL